MEEYCFTLLCFHFQVDPATGMVMNLVDLKSAMQVGIVYVQVKHPNSGVKSNLKHFSHPEINHGRDGPQTFRFRCPIF